MGNIFSNPGLAVGQLPGVTASDSGKTLVVNENGEWVVGDSGGGGSGAGSLIVHVTATVDEGAILYSLVTPYSDILAAIESGIIPLMKIEVEGAGAITYSAFTTMDTEGLMSFSFGDGTYLSIDNTGSVISG
jgi:hypothetical protein